MTELVEHMQMLGWVEAHNGDIVNEALGVTYPNWLAAIKACIEVACEGVLE